MIESALERAQFMVTAEHPEEWDRGGLRESLMLQYLVTVDSLTDAEATPSIDKMVERTKAEGEETFRHDSRTRGRPERSVSLRVGKEVQEVPRGGALTRPHPTRRWRPRAILAGPSFRMTPAIRRGLCLIACHVVSSPRSLRWYTPHRIAWPHPKRFEIRSVRCR